MNRFCLYNLYVLPIIFLTLGVGGQEKCRAADGKFVVTVVDKESKEPIPCRMHLTGPKKQPRRVAKLPFWQDHFALPGTVEMKLPLGDYNFILERGPEYLHREGYFTIKEFADDAKEFDLSRFINMSKEGWWSGDLDIRRPLNEIEPIILADDLHLAEDVSWINDKSEWQKKELPKKNPTLFDKDRWYDLMAGSWSQNGTEVCLYHLKKPLPLKKEAGEGESLVKKVVELKKSEPEVWVDVTRPYAWDLPTLIAHEAVDSVRVAHGNYGFSKMTTTEGEGKPRNKSKFLDPFGNALWSQHIYFQLLECGLRIPPSAASESGVASNPVGYNRMYVPVEGSFDYDTWWQRFAEGKVILTNSPMIRVRVNGEYPGAVFRATKDEKMEFEIEMNLATREKIAYLDIIHNGAVEQTIRFADYQASGKLPLLRYSGSGWFMLRVVTENTKIYRFAETAPFYIEFDGQKRISKKSVQFFLDWINERIAQVEKDKSPSAGESLPLHHQAKSYWEELLKKANAE